MDFVGREIELAELETLLGSGRLATVTGPGGVGKTTLVTQLTHGGSDPNGRPVFVDLTAVEEPSGVEPAIAAAMGQARFATISSSTCSDDVLVIIDNCEHVLDAVASAVSELRAVLPAAAVCATSRMPLGLRDEAVLSLGPLGLPRQRSVDTTVSSVELFLSVARRSGGTIADDDLDDVCELCRRVDGIPLAIEIVATRTRSMSVAEILERLGEGLDLVSHGGFRREERHRSVRETVEWSYELLGAGERHLFDCLGVVGGQCSAPAAHTVAAEPSLERTLELLDELVARSLLVAERGVDGSTWYRQLHAVRACARDHLTSTGEFEAAAERFVDHMVGEAGALAEHARDGWRPETFVLITALSDGLLHALRWSTDHDDTPRRAFELATVLWGHQSRTDEVLTALTRALERWPDEREPHWADAAAAAATCLWIAGRTDDADRLIDRALPNDADATFAAVLLRRTRGQIRREQGRYDEATRWLSGAADAARNCDLLALVLDAELLRAAVLAAQGEPEAALESTARIRDLGADPTIAEVLALSIEADVWLQVDPLRAVAEARRGAELTGGTWYSAATIGFARTEAIGLVLVDDISGAATALRRAVDIMSTSGVFSQARPVLEAVALVAERAGRTRWVDLVSVANALPATDVLTSPARLLPEAPAATGPLLGLADALRISVEVLEGVATHGTPTVRREPEPASGADAGQESTTIQSNRLLRRGDHWEIGYAGESFMARHTKGIGDLAELLARPDTEIPAADLFGAAVVSSDMGEVLDAQARSQYEQRIRDLQAELVEAEDNNDTGRAEKATAELDALVDQLTSAVGLGGRARRSGGSSERARTAVTRRIRTAIAHLDGLSPALGRHLDASVRTGTYCAYRPETATKWDVQF